MPVGRSGFSLKSKQHSTTRGIFKSEMQFTFKFQFICLWLLWSQVLGQDIEPEFPEDFPTTSTEAASTTTTELPTTTTTDMPTTTTLTTELSTTEKVTTTSTIVKAATKRPTTTTSPPTTFTTELPTISTWPPYYPTYAPPTRPPHFTPAYHWLWDLYESDEVRCYLRDQVKSGRVRWSCGFTSSFPITSCYRCCYYGNSRFAGCSQLHNGRCSEKSTNWQI